MLSSTSVNTLQSSMPQDEIAVYPNPVGDNLTIDLKGTGNEQVAFTMYDVLGRVRLQQTLAQAAGGLSGTTFFPLCCAFCSVLCA